jgi:hypothetical protein
VKITDYQVASGPLGKSQSNPNARPINEVVSSLIAEGWQPFGSAYCSTISGTIQGMPQVTIHHQPMVKYL